MDRAESSQAKPGPAEALVLPCNVSVWALIDLWQLDTESIPNVADEYEPPREAVEAAICYYGRHQAEVDARIARNNAYFAP